MSAAEAKALFHTCQFCGEPAESGHARCSRCESAPLCSQCGYPRIDGGGCSASDELCGLCVYENASTEADEKEHERDRLEAMAEDAAEARGEIR